MVDGKPQNAFGMDEKAMDRDYTLKVATPRTRWLASPDLTRLTRLAWLAPLEPLRSPTRPSPLRVATRPGRSSAHPRSPSLAPCPGAQVIQETNEFWKTLTAKGQKTV